MIVRVRSLKDNQMCLPCRPGMALPSGWAGRPQVVHDGCRAVRRLPEAEDSG